MVEFGKTIGEALRFSIDPRRWLPFFVVDAVVLVGIMGYLMANAYTIIDVLTVAATGAEGLAIASSIIGVVATLLLVFIVWMLVRIFISGAIIQQALKPEESGKSWNVAKQRFLSMLAASVIIGAVSLIVGLVPYVGPILSLIVGIIFFFSLAAVVADKLSFDKALAASYRMFRNRFADVFISWLLIAIISAVIMVIFMIPVFIVAFQMLLPLLMQLDAAAGPEQVIPMLVTSGWSLLPAGLILFLGSSVTNVFGLYGQTHFYLQIRKKRGVLKI